MSVRSKYFTKYIITKKENFKNDYLVRPLEENSEVLCSSPYSSTFEQKSFHLESLVNLIKIL